MPNRDVSTIRDLIYYQYATVIAKSAFAAFDGEGRLKLWGDKKCYDSIPPLLVRLRKESYNVMGVPLIGPQFTFSEPGDDYDGREVREKR